MFTDPEANVMEFGFLPGNKVADLGSGAGHYSDALSTAVGSQGVVYAIDIQKDMLVRLKNESLGKGKTNIEVIWGNIEEPLGTKLKDGIADGAVFSNILFALHDRTAAVAEAKRIVKGGGKICVVEWSDLSFLANTPSGGKTAVSADETKKLFLDQGCSLEREFPAGEHHYGLIFRKSIQ